MILHLQRSAPSADATRGILYLNGEKYSTTIEPLPSAQYPCIPAGTYTIIVTHSPKFKKDMPLLVGVRGRTGIRIHAGTKAEHTQGCICVPLQQFSGLRETIISTIRRNEKVTISITDSVQSHDDQL